MASDHKFYPLKGSIYYGHFFTPDKYGKYSVAVGNLSEQNAKALRSLGVIVKEDTEKGMGLHMHFRSKFPFKVVDSDGNDWDNNKFFGNGSKAVFTFYTTPSNAKSGFTPYCVNVKVTEYIAFTPEAKENNEDLSEAVNDTPKVSLKKQVSAPIVDFEEA